MGHVGGCLGIEGEVRRGLLLGVGVGVGWCDVVVVNIPSNTAECVYYRRLEQAKLAPAEEVGFRSHTYLHA